MTIGNVIGAGGIGHTRKAANAKLKTIVEADRILEEVANGKSVAQLAVELNITPGGIYNKLKHAEKYRPDRATIEQQAVNPMNVEV
jgi:DNA-binding CsgD family transcriptional regulator